MVSRAATSGATRKEEHLSVLAVWDNTMESS